MLISIYASRVLLDKLGVDNYGIYNLVGGVVVTFTSLRGVFAQSVQRFLNYEKGLDNNEKVREIFSISLYIHILLGVVFAIIVISFGILYIPKYLVLPTASLETAMFVFYMSIFTAVIGIITIPYDSVIVANEKFDFFAINSILEAISKFGILYLLFIGNDNLRTYALLITIVSVFFRLTCIVYCVRFAECKLKIVWNKCIFKELSSFGWWNFLGNTAYSLTNEGINFIINIFGGVTANAARGLAYQVKNAVIQLSSNVGIASRPYITEAVARQKKEVIFNHIIIVSKMMFLIISLTALPLLTYTEQILFFWLKEVPPNTVIFVQLVVVHLVIRSPETGIDILFAAYNKMRDYQIVQSSILFLSLPLAYVLLKNGYPLYWAFIGMIWIELFTLISVVLCASKKMVFPLGKYTKEFFIRAIILSIQLCIIGFIFNRFIPSNNILEVMICSIIEVSIALGTATICYMSHNEKKILISLIHKNDRTMDKL